MSLFHLLIVAAFGMFCSRAQSQITNVPNASEQPKWFMPIIIEDATQARDTIYLGSDPNASSAIYDPNFGEIFTPIANPSSFRASIYEFGGEALKVQILEEDYLELSGISIECHNAMGPIKIYWDDIMRLHSDSLPFPATVPNGPRAQLFIYHDFSFGLIQNPNHFDCWQGGVLISDTLANEPAVTPVADTLFIDPGFPDTSLHFGLFVFTFTHWTGDCSVFLELDELTSHSNFELLPNPARDHTTIRMSESTNGPVFIQILDGLGRVVQEIEAPSGSSEIELNLSDYKPGVYYVKLTSEESSTTKKLLVN
ncbi:MAG: hypothetical protein ACI837_002868 [Crocinitomicaceae bacterium]|jgi:hypothetical protein